MNELVEVNLKDIYKSDSDIHAYLQDAGILEECYIKIASGISVPKIAKLLNLPLDTCNYILKCTEEGRRKLLKAKMFSVGDKSLDVISESFATVTMLDAEEARAAKHHTDIIRYALESHKEEKNNDGNNITVINNTIIADKKDIPDMPEVLKNL